MAIYELKGESGEMANSERGMTFKPGTAFTISAAILAAGLWLGALQAQVLTLQQEVSDTKNTFVTISKKLDRIEERILAVQLSLNEEIAQQRILHRGQLPADGR